MMAATDDFDILVTGIGGHAADPHKSVDPIVIAAAIVGSLQTIASRSADPVDSLVVSVTEFHAGTAYNVIPDTAVLRGTVRSFDPALRQRAEAAMRRIALGIAESLGGSARVDYLRGYPSTRNHEAPLAKALDVAAKLVGPERVDRNVSPVMGGEDFAYMLEARPGAYLFIGAGSAKGGRNLHQTHYDFNDEILPLGASYWAQLVEALLAKA